MKIQAGELVHIYPTEVWFEKDFLGTIHVMIQHMAPDEKPFEFISIAYNYAYTSNSHQRDLVKKIGQLLGVEDIPERAWTMPDSWKIKDGEIDQEARNLIITNMCYTWRHDYGLDKQIGTGFADTISAGMTEDERQALWRQMAQIFDNDIAPHMEFKK